MSLVDQTRVSRERDSKVRDRSKLFTAGLLLVTLAACTASPTAEGPSPGGTDGSTPVGPTIDVSGQAISHVHNLALDGSTLLLGTHEGLYEQKLGQQPNLLSQPPFDVMGLAKTTDGWLASGHPVSANQLPADLGLRHSPDGRKWTDVSLLGAEDFHRLAVSGSTVLGLSSHGGKLMRSSDRGVTWKELGAPELFDIALHPADPSLLVATSVSGPVRSTDGGQTWNTVNDAPVIAFLSWTRTGLYGLAPDGALFVSTSNGQQWEARGDVGNQPTALVASRQVVAAVVGESVVQSTDAGRNFEPRLIGLPR